MAKRMNGAIRAAGGVLWRSISKDRGGEPVVEVAVIHRPRYDDWSLPKGKLAPGESEIEGAVREVWEETGFRVRMGRPIGEIRYLKRNSFGAERPGREPRRVDGRRPDQAARRAGPAAGRRSSARAVSIRRGRHRLGRFRSVWSDR